MRPIRNRQKEPNGPNIRSSFCTTESEIVRTALLLVGILSRMGYGCALIKFDDHIAVGLKGDQSIDGTYFENDGIKYYYIETTNRGWRIGEIPDEYVGLPATVIVIS